MPGVAQREDDRRLAANAHLRRAAAYRLCGTCGRRLRHDHRCDAAKPFPERPALTWARWREMMGP